MKSFFTLLAFCFTVLTYGQTDPEEDGYYHTQIKIAGIENPAAAKDITDPMRAVTGIVLVSFDDDTDTFTFRSEKEFKDGKIFYMLKDKGFAVIEMK